jgi:hypothetical protein
MDEEQDYSYRVVSEHRGEAPQTLLDTRDKEEALDYVDGVIEGMVGAGSLHPIAIYTVSDADPSDVQHWVTIDPDDEKGFASWRKTSRLLHLPPRSGLN